MTTEIRSQNVAARWLGAAAGESSLGFSPNTRRHWAKAQATLRVRFFAPFMLFASILPAPAQLGLPAETDVFGDEIVRKINADNGGGRFGGGEEEVAAKPKAKVAGFDHALVFHDGRRLRGELVELTKSEVVWRRPDASEPLRLARSAVQRLVLAAGVEEENSGRGRQMMPANVEAYVRKMILLCGSGLGEMIGEAVAQSATLDVARAVRIPGIVMVTSRQMAQMIKEAEAGFGGVARAEENADENKPAPPTATVKLPGGDWLFGEVTSADGETFALKLADGTLLAIPRAPVAWLHFGAQPAPAFGFAGGALDLESWPVRTPGARAEVAGGTLTLHDGWVLGRALTPPKRFEVAFEVPDDAEEGLRLWIQPFGPQPNCYGRGTVELQFGKKEISHCIYVNKFDHKKSPLPKDAAAAKGPVRYRVLYDGLGRHLAVLRNGAQIGGWKFSEDADKDAKQPAQNEEEQEMTISGVAFDRTERGAGKGLRFNALRVQPWDGMLPEAGAEPQAGDRLTVGKERPVVGKLESLAATELVFSGAKKPRLAGTFLQLHETGPSLADADAMLVFGRQGEVSVADLEIRAGRARGRTGFASTLDLPAAALQTVVFSSRAAEARQPADALVFKNGDELPGTLLAATAGASVRWKMAGGQELEFQAARLAGVRFAAAGAAQKHDEPALLELRNGDRLRGEFVALDDRQLQFQHAQFGTVTIARERLWSLYPNPHFAVSDGGREAAAWLGAGNKKTANTADDAPSSAAAQWTVLDGSYILRGERSSSGSQESAVLNAPLTAVPDRFELRAEVTDANGNPPSFNVALGEKKTGGVLNASISYSEMYVYVNNPQVRGRNSSRSIALRDKIPDAGSRLALRVFADRKAGTADFFLNGAFVARLGQQPNERLPGLGDSMTITASQQEDSAVILSNLWVGPWSGEMPRAGDGTPAATALRNGDAAPAAPDKWQDGKFIVETAAGPLELLLEKVQAVEFGGVMTPEKAAGRIRLADGCAVNVDGFRWDGKELAAHSAVLGDLRLAAGVVSELIFDPAPARPPRTPVAKKLAQKNNAGAPQAAEAGLEKTEPAQ